MSLGDGLTPKSRICYFYDRNVGNFHYGIQHPMKPHRMTLTHHLVMNYGLLDKMTVIKPNKLTDEELSKYHTMEYLDFLKKANPDASYDEAMEFGLYGDCPGFPGAYEFCQYYAAGSVEGAYKLNQKRADICINWAGGLHHARKSEGSGFCYVNDIVLAIVELLRYHPRVLYIDIDIHHGDGVQDAFYYSDRVMCVSLHKYGEDFFPGTGDITEVGLKQGKYYSLNIPLKDGIDDKSYLSLFKPIIGAVMDRYRPTAVVLQCGADSLRGDRIGAFNLSLDGHAECVRYVKSFNLPLLVLGGGGYTVKNVARCWANETGVLCGETLPNDIPQNDYFTHYGPYFQLRDEGDTFKFDNMNSKKDLEILLETTLKNLAALEFAPSVQMQYIPSVPYDDLEDVDDDIEDFGE